MSYRDLARVANLSANATAERIQRLQTAGVILGFSADISAAAPGLSLSAYVDVKLRPGTSMEAFEAALVKIEGIRDAASLTGTFDARLLVDVEIPKSWASSLKSCARAPALWRLVAPSSAVH